MAAVVVGLLIGRYPGTRYSIHHGYVDAVVAQGAVPMLIPAGEGCGRASVAELIALSDALVATGGGDVDPATYGREAVPELTDIDRARDDVELDAVRQARADGRPVLGICRGAQVLAVAMGGTLVPDLPTAGLTGHWDEEHEHQPVHGIEIEPGSVAAAALGGADTVNSIHHQAIEDPGPHLRATAWAPDGVIEAVEAPGVLALQWHPERLAGTDPRHHAPFEWLVKEVGR